MCTQIQNKQHVLQQDAMQNNSPKSLLNSNLRHKLTTENDLEKKDILSNVKEEY